MESEHSSGVREEGVVWVDGFEIGRDQTGLPLVMVDDLRRESQELTKGESRFGKEDEPFGIIKVIPLGCAVKIFSVIELVTADEINRDILGKPALINIRLQAFISKGDLYLLPKGLKRKSGVFDHSVAGHQQFQLAT
jgi:hypothetical protein